MDFDQFCYNLVIEILKTGSFSEHELVCIKDRVNKMLEWFNDEN